MEISRKKITDEKIYESEKKLMESSLEIITDFEGKFSEIGYVLETEFLRDNDSSDITPEEKTAVRSSKIAEEPGAYANGYSSHVKITVKLKKTAEDIEAENAENEVIEASETLSEEEAEQLRNEKEAAQAQRELKRSVAFTTMMFVRVYKTFWRETISISENTDEIKADLEEFFEVLEAKAGKGE